MQITKDEQGTRVVSESGWIVAIITAQTPQDETDRFVALVKEHKDELEVLCFDCSTAVDWNQRHPGKGKDWPAFRKKERFVRKLLDQAGVIDS